MKDVSDPIDLPLADIKNQLDKILASSLFIQSLRQCRFLQYVVEETLSGNIDRLKGYSIAIEVFDRDESFDSAIDSIVRVEAGRLRSKLREYYQTEGRDDPIQIELPKGKYSPVFSRLESNSRSIDSKHIDRNTVAYSIAVLPLRVLSNDIEQNYFSDGMTDAIIYSLAKKEQIKVISLTSVMCFKNTDKSLKNIAEELSVSHVLEGTVLCDGENIRITAQLIEASTDTHLWAESYEREFARIFELQREISEVIAAKLTQKLLPDNDNEFKQKNVSLEAYELYLLGRRTRAKLTKEGFYEAADYFKRASSIELEYAAAFSGMASCYCGLGSHGFELESPVETIPQGLEYAKHAMELDASLVDAHTYTGIMKLKYEWDWQAAAACFEKALSISPNDARAHLQYSMLFESLAKHDRAIFEAQQAHSVDPLSKETNMNLAWQFYQADQFQDAEKLINNFLKIEPDFWGAYWDLAYISLAQNKNEQAIEYFKKSDESTGGYFMPLQGLGYAYAVCGKEAEAKDVIKKLDEIKKENYVSPYYYATIYMGLGKIEQAFEYLEQALELRSRSMAWLNVAKEYTSLRDDKRFKRLIKKIGIPS